MIHIQEKSIRRVFIAGLILKGLFALLETSAGVLLLFTQKIAAAISFLAQTELIEDPNDFLAMQTQHFMPYFLSHGHAFGSFYLLSHGIIKLILIINLIRGKLWAYPATIGLLFLFIVYQLYRIWYSFSVFLLVLTVLDLILIYLTWHEYNLVRKHHIAQPQN